MNRSIQLHADLTVDPPAKAIWLGISRPSTGPRRASSPGTSICTAKAHRVTDRNAPPGLSYRFSITYESEAQRLAWVSSDVHSEVWGTLESSLTSHDYTFLLFDVL